MNVIKKLFILVIVMLLVGGLTAGCAPLGGQPKGWSGGVVAKDALFLGSMEGKLIALDASGGNQLWVATLETPSAGGGFFGCAPPSTVVAMYGTPAVLGDLVYVGGYNGKIYACSSSSGALRWVYPREGNVQPIVGGLVVALGRVYFGCADGKLYALDAETGDKEWEFEIGDKIWTTPAIDGDTLYIGSFDKKLYAIEATEGRKKWEFEAEGAIASTPLVYNNTVYIGSFDRHLYAVDAAGGSLRWRSEVEAGGWFWAKPVAHNGVIYAGCLDHKVYVLDAKNGGKINEFDLGSPVSSSPVLVGNTVIIASEAGKVYSLDAGASQIEPVTNLEAKVCASLSANEGIVYVHTQEDEAVYALNVETRVILWSTLLSSK